ncbi:MAG: SIS domain-containing protein [Aestuariivita sp.]|nr:SIS domain-containing protein [Aestuariivita sp.]MCY4203828.1 SIS domain-containing protein [Aestuariivita sp.]MCY4288443.1 SIS domain-containing protein [Aestuariivita sp.]
MTTGTMMAAEITEIPAMIERQLRSRDTYLETGRMLKVDGTRGIITCARGTSDNAATFFKYLVETQIGLPVSSIGPSVASVYEAKLRLDGFACLTFSQSGGSPDLALLQSTAKLGGAKTIAILNQVESPVGEGANQVLPILAGPEKAVAATKSFVGMLTVSLAVVAGYLDDKGLLEALSALPGLIEESLKCDWSAAKMRLARSSSLFCIGRGLNLAIAAEAALKLKETCRLHAEAYSAAELLHGPVAIADDKLGALVFGSEGKSADAINTTFERLREQGAQTYLVNSTRGHNTLLVPKSGSELIDPVLQAVCFYRFAENLSIEIGENPDAPPGLLKVTETV